MQHIMIRRSCLRHFAPAILLCSNFLLECSAAEITITNNSFENPVLSEGAGILSVPGWAHQGTVQIINPNNSYFSNTTDGSPDSPLDGFNAVGVNVTGPNGAGKLSYQTTNLVFAASVYSLTFLAGHRFGSPFGNASVSLWAGTNLLAERFPNPLEGTFMPFSLSYTSPPTGSMIGMPLRIELNPEGTDSQPWFDNFHLFSNACSPHRATATAQVINGFVVDTTITDSGCGYTSAPPVVIIGGGGSGAAATAIVSNGAIARIIITSAGCCYTNAPIIEIGSPPFIPTLSIRVSKVKVTQNVTLGRRYVLESSHDLTTWAPTGPAFTAESETIEGEFDVDVTGRFFQVREVP